MRGFQVATQTYVTGVAGGQSQTCILGLWTDISTNQSSCRTPRPGIKTKASNEATVAAANAQVATRDVRIHSTIRRHEIMPLLNAQ